MLTDEQCIEVARLWGMDTHEIEYKSKVLTQGMVATDLNPTVLQVEVNSWSGFGRTVEAMAGKKWWFQIAKDKHKEEDFGFWGGLGRFFPLQFNPFEPTSIIEATHLAALEAIK